MEEKDLPEHIKRFIFDVVDSVELLDVLFLVSAHPEKSWSPDSVSAELRSNPNSVEKRLLILKKFALVQEVEGSPLMYRYAPTDANLKKTVADLAAVYGQKRHRILELIFSPMKQARVIADGFRIQSKSKGEGEHDG